jgi:hypothetical protein
LYRETIADVEEQTAWLCTEAPLLLLWEKEMEDEVMEEQKALAFY